MHKILSYQNQASSALQGARSDCRIPGNRVIVGKINVKTYSSSSIDGGMDGCKIGGEHAGDVNPRSRTRMRRLSTRDKEFHSFIHSVAAYTPT